MKQFLFRKIKHRSTFTFLLTLILLTPTFLIIPSSAIMGTHNGQNPYLNEYGQDYSYLTNKIGKSKSTLFFEDVQLHQRKKLEKIADILAIQFNDFDIKYPYVFLACGGDGLKIVDVSNLTNPVIIYENDTFPELTNVDVDVDRELLLIHNKHTYIVLDISNVYNPEILATETGNYGDVIIDAQIKNGYIYILGWYFGLKIFEIRNNKFYKIGSYSVENPSYSNFFVESNLVFLISNYMSKIDVLNQTDISEISLLVSYSNSSERIITSYYSENLLYLVVTPDNGRTYFVKILRLKSDYSGIYPVTTVSINETHASLIYVDNNMVFLVSEALITIFDATDISSLHFITNINITGLLPSFRNEVFKIIVHNEIAYVLSQDSYLLLLDVSDKDSISVLSYLYRRNVFSVERLKVKNNYVFALSSRPSLEIINSTVPSNLSLVSSFEYASSELDSYQDICIDGDYVFIASLDKGIFSLNITNIEDPVFVGEYKLKSDNVYSMVLDNDLLFALTEEKKLMVFNVSTPSEIKLVSETTIDGGYAFSMDLSLYQNYLFAITPSGLRIIDVSDPVHPKMASLFPVGVGDSFLKVFVKDKYAFVITSKGYLLIIDVADPTDPHLVRNVEFYFSVTDLFIDGYYLYLLPGSREVVIYNASDVLNLREVAYYAPPQVLDFFWFNPYDDIFVDGDYVYLAGGKHGIEVTFFPHVRGNITYVPWSSVTTNTSTPTTSTLPSTTFKLPVTTTNNGFLISPSLFWEINTFIVLTVTCFTIKKKRKETP